MKGLILVALLLVFQALSTRAMAAMRVSTGFSTVTSGRQVPALGLGIAYEEWSASVMLAGARTDVYYSSGIMVNALRTQDWGEFWFGRLEVGFGAGAFHGEKGIYTDLDTEGKPTNLEKDQDNLIGPAFRVAFKPFEHVHLSLEYMMGIGSSIVSNAWGDVGMGAIGVDL